MTISVEEHQMHILQRIRFPVTSSLGSLYFTHDSTAKLDMLGTEPCFRFSPGQRLCSGSYGNSFFEFIHRRFGNRDKQALELFLEGDFNVDLWSAAFNAPPQHLSCVSVKGCVRTSPTVVPLPIIEKDAVNQRIYFNITAQSEGIFWGGRYVTKHAPQVVRLAIVLCTFRRENFLQNTVKRILADSFLMEKVSAIVVVDNGRTVDPSLFHDQRILILPNRNCGGAGGFSRGMVEILQKGLGTHILLMDDDVECDSEAILRTVTFYEHGQQSVALAGAMIDLQQPHLQYESGALYGRAATLPGTNPLKIMGLGRGLCLEQQSAINALLLQQEADYGAFWYFSFPLEYVRQCGLTLPFFVIGDDIEFGLRLKKYLNAKIVPYPGVGVWHQPFYSKISFVKRYFFVRNLLVIDVLYNNSTYWTIAKAIFCDFLSDICKFNYGMVCMLLRAFEDFLKGPDFFVGIDPLERIEQLLSEGKSLDDNIFAFTPQNMYGFEQPVKDGFLRSTYHFFTLGGHFLPRILLRGRPMEILLGGQQQWKKNFFCAKAYFLHPEAGFSNAREIKARRGILLAFQLAKAVLSGYGSWKRAKSAWRTQAQHLRSPEFWEHYCTVNT